MQRMAGAGGSSSAVAGVSGSSNASKPGGAASSSSEQNTVAVIASSSSAGQLSSSSNTLSTTAADLSPAGNQGSSSTSIAGQSAAAAPPSGSVAATPAATAAAAASTPSANRVSTAVNYSISNSSSGIGTSSASRLGSGGLLARRSIGAVSSLGHSYSGTSDGFKVRVGICAMDKKANSKPMREIIGRLVAYGEFEVVNFGDELILHHPITEWPRVDCLMSWYSDGFPLGKAQEYADATRPFLINDLHMQNVLQDRRAVYKLLQENGTAVPAHIVVNREVPGEDPPGFIEEEDYVELDNVRIDKPFVEKPTSGEDHNIHIYYPHSMGGGVKRLFRKVDNKSSCYDPHHPGTVRRDGSYIYEEFLTTGGTDVKVYTVGPRYAHAEARKSPVVDGRVLRTPDGKEMRFPVLLNPAEKEISRMVCLAFGQKVCGFDLLRSEKGRSYVCDVNGWSFVKNSKKYYDDSAGILRSIILAALAPHRLPLAPSSGSPLSLTLSLTPMTQQSMAALAASGAGGATTAGRATAAAVDAAAAAAASFEEEQIGYMRKTPSLAEVSSLMAELSTVDLVEAARTDERSTREELRCVLAVIRHGDRTPKQKLKVRVRQPALLALFVKHADSKGKQAKLKSPAQLQELLDISRSLLQELERPLPVGLSEEDIETREEQREKLRIVKTVLEQGGQFSGINRKVQLKPLTWYRPPPPAAEQDSTSDSHAAAGTQTTQQEGKSQQDKQQQGSDGGNAADASTKQQQDNKQQPVLQEVLLILKYGGVLTHAGRAQAEELGKVFRMVMYPRYGSTGGGLLRLHSTYRHDLKIYSSDEGRVQVSAAAFTKGLLDLEGSSLTPILVSLVTKDASMLDAFGKGASEDIRNAKQVLYTAMTWDPATASSNQLLPTYSRSTTPAPTPLITTPPRSPNTLSRTSSTAGMHVAATVTGVSSVGQGSEQQQMQQHLAAGAFAAAATVAAAAAAVASRAADAVPSSSSNIAVQSQAAVADGSSGGSGSSQPKLHPNSSSQPLNPSNSVGSPAIPGMPDHPLLHLKRLNELMKLMVEQLRELVLAEKRQGTPSSSTKDLPAAAAAAANATAATATNSTGSSNTYTAADPKTSVNSLLEHGSNNPPRPSRPSTAPPASPGVGSGEGAGAAAAAAGAGSRYSSLSCDPADWQLEPGQPCSGERLLLMFDRWQKLAKSFYKKGKFDISKVPDIYDSGKYDALHNAHLGLGPVLEELYKEAKILADAVIPNEYGVNPAGKLAIGSKIATELLAKLLDDLRASKDESLATLTDAERSGLANPGVAGAETGLADGIGLSRHSVPVRFGSVQPPSSSGGSSSNKPAAKDAAAAAEVAAAAVTGVAAAAATCVTITEDQEESITRAASAYPILGPASAATAAGGEHAGGDEAEIEGLADGDEGGDREPELMHRLCPTYASDINSPLRHVRTRIYFTSESHMHSLVNLLRFCHLRHSLLGSSSDNVNGSSTVHSGITSSTRASTDGGPRASVPAAKPAGDSAAKTAGSSSGDNGSSNHSSNRSSTASAFSAAANAPSSLLEPATAAAPVQRKLSTGLGSTPPSPTAVGLNLPPAGPSGTAPAPLLSEEGLELLRNTAELDYLTHLVFRLYENMAVGAHHPQRFRLEILFCPGASYDPTQVVPPMGNHTLSPRPRVELHQGEGATLADFDRLLRPFAAKCKGATTTSGNLGFKGAGS